MSKRHWFLLLSLGIVLASTALQLAGLRGGTVIDDKRLIADYENRGCGADPIDCFHNMMFGFYYRPVLSASIAIGQKFHNNRPLWFHIENLLLHAVVVALALWMFRLLFKRRLSALTAGLLFALHPIQVCITTFVGGRTDTMVVIFILLFAIGVRNAGRRIALLDRVRDSAAMLKIAAWIGVSLVGLLAAAFTKEQIVPLALLAPLLALPLRVRHRSMQRRPNTSLPVSRRRDVARKPMPYWTIIYAVPVAVFAFAAHSALHDIDFVKANWSPGLRIEMVGRTLWFYTRIYLFPTVNTLHMTTLGSWDSPQLAVAVLGYMAALIWVVLLVRNWRNRSRRILMLWASLGLISCLNIVPIPTQFASPYRSGISLFGIAGFVGSLIAPDESRRQLVSGQTMDRELLLRVLAIAGMSIWCAVITVTDVPNWFDEVALMKAEVAADPNFVCARAALADFDLQRGENQEALRQFDACLIELFGAATPVAAYPQKVRSEAMVRALQSASTLRYYSPIQYIPQVVRERGRTLLQINRPSDALPDLRVALQLNPADTIARAALEASYRRLHEDREADAVHKMDDVLLGRKL